MTYEEKMRRLAEIKPEYRDGLLLRIIKGETVDITKDEDLFYQVNRDRVSLNEFTNRSKFKHVAKATKFAKDGLYDKRHARTHSKKMRWLGDIPTEIFFSRPEFSPLLPNAERTTNIKKFLNEFPAFKAGEGKV